MEKQELFKKFFVTIFVLIVCFWIFNPYLAKAERDFTCAVYFTGVGCSHCAKTDPVVLKDSLKQYSDLVIIEYEIYQQKGNAPVLDKYCEIYNLPYCRPGEPPPCCGLPLIIFTQDHQNIIAGDAPILKGIKTKIKSLKGNKCPLMDGDYFNFNNLDITTLPGAPKIWTNNRILIKDGREGYWGFAWNSQGAEEKSLEDITNHKDILQQLIKTKDIPNTVKGINYNTVGSIAVPLSGQSVRFDNAIEFIVKGEKVIPFQTLTLTKVLSLAAVDAVNPCALAVLILMLIAILTYNPKNRRNILLAGWAFVFSVFVMYLLYGLVIIKFFQLIQALTIIRLWLYKALGGIAIILGLLNIKDFIKYKPGSLGTEMPMFMRPRLKKIISGITSPKGAFIVGAFVTIFLLPCTIGPYVICGGILCPLGLLKSLPWLLLYNLIFIIPMLIIVGFVYVGVAKVEDVSDWKDKNIRYLHLIAGLIILGLGVAMFLGLV